MLILHDMEVDGLIGDMLPQEFRIMPSVKDDTIAWALWHISRIEDMTMSILVGCTDELFDLHWKEKMGATISDTGNALTDEEVMQLSKALNRYKFTVY